MFSQSSRYYKLKTVQATTKDGRTVTAVKLRRLPYVEGRDTVIKGHDRLDIMAQRQYDDPTRFWHIADANTELEANALVKETGRVIKVPER